MHSANGTTRDETGYRSVRMEEALK